MPDLLSTFQEGIEVTQTGPASPRSAAIIANGALEMLWKDTNDVMSDFTGCHKRPRNEGMCAAPAGMISSAPSPGPARSPQQTGENYPEGPAPAQGLSCERGPNPPGATAETLSQESQVINRTISTQKFWS